MLAPYYGFLIRGNLMSNIFFNNNHIDEGNMNATITGLCDLDATPNQQEMVGMLAKHHEAFAIVEHKLAELRNISSIIRSEIIFLKSEMDYFKSTVENKISFIDNLFYEVKNNPILQTEWERFLIMLKLSVER